MDRLTEIRERLRETKAILEEIERATAADPESLSLLAMVRSIRKQIGNLESVLAELERYQTKHAEVTIDTGIEQYDARTSPKNKGGVK